MLIYNKKCVPAAECEPERCKGYHGLLTEICKWWAKAINSAGGYWWRSLSKILSEISPAL